ncbi:MAG TPA: hypothetical protein DIW26_01435 [Ruminococcus sp.]|nr:hypothetical protein [Ruminococcus sp.]
MNSKKKSFIARAVTMLMAVFTIAIGMAFPVSVSAAELSDADVITASVEVESVTVTPLLLTDNSNLIVNAAEVKLLPMAAMSGQTDGDAQFESVITFFVKWIRRIGMVVALVGGIMFALAIKSNDAEQKQAGLLTLVAGFVVAALCGAVSMFDIFT